MKIVFIAGPYFGEGDYGKIEENIRCAEKYQIQLANNGIGFFCPHNHTEHFEKKAKAEEKFYRELDMLMLSKVANAILAIPGWEKSSGAKAEIEWAATNNLKVFYPKSPEDIEDIVIWAR
ncbi:MAG: DUF1937 family protein [bacterium]|nr:DUF1937 family protein [bacterium]